MPIKQIIGNRHKLFVPPGIVSLVSADQEQRCASGVKCKEYPQVPFVHLSSQFLHVGVTRTDNHVGMGTRSAGPRSSRSSTLAAISSCSSSDKEFHQTAKLAV